MAEFNKPLQDKDITWGIFASFGVGVAAFLGSRILVGFLIAAIAGSRGQTINEFFGEDNFMLSFVIALAVSVITTLIVMAYMKRKDFWRRVGLRKTSLDDLLTALPTYAAYFLAAFIANIALAAFFPEVDFNIDQQTGFEDASGLALALAFLTLVVVAPFFEELLFRGFIFRGLAAASSFWPAAITTSLLFGLAHASAFETSQLALVIDTFLVGMAASWLTWHTRSIVPAILLHGIKNFMAFVFIFIIETNSL